MSEKSPTNGMARTATLESGSIRWTHSEYGQSPTGVAAPTDECFPADDEEGDLGGMEETVRCAVQADLATPHAHGEITSANTSPPTHMARPAPRPRLSSTLDPHAVLAAISGPPTPFASKRRLAATRMSVSGVLSPYMMSSGSREHMVGSRIGSANNSFAGERSGRLVTPLTASGVGFDSADRPRHGGGSPLVKMKGGTSFNASSTHGNLSGYIGPRGSVTSVSLDAPQPRQSPVSPHAQNLVRLLSSPASGARGRRESIALAESILSRSVSALSVSASQAATPLRSSTRSRRGKTYFKCGRRYYRPTRHRTRAGAAWAKVESMLRCLAAAATKEVPSSPTTKKKRRVWDRQAVLALLHLGEELFDGGPPPAEELAMVQENVRGLKNDRVALMDERLGLEAEVAALQTLIFQLEDDRHVLEQERLILLEQIEQYENSRPGVRRTQSTHSTPLNEGWNELISLRRRSSKYQEEICPDCNQPYGNEKWCPETGIRHVSQAEKEENILRRRLSAIGRDTLARGFIADGSVVYHSEGESPEPSPRDVNRRQSRQMCSPISLASSHFQHGEFIGRDFDNSFCNLDEEGQQSSSRRQTLRSTDTSESASYCRNSRSGLEMARGAHQRFAGGGQRGRNSVTPLEFAAVEMYRTDIYRKSSFAAPRHSPSHGGTSPARSTVGNSPRGSDTLIAERVGAPGGKSPPTPYPEHADPPIPGSGRSGASGSAADSPTPLLASPPLLPARRIQTGGASGASPTSSPSFQPKGRPPLHASSPALPISRSQSSGTASPHALLSPPQAPETPPTVRTAPIDDGGNESLLSLTQHVDIPMYDSEGGTPSDPPIAASCRRVRDAGVAGFGSPHTQPQSVDKLEKKSTLAMMDVQTLTASRRIAFDDDSVCGEDAEAPAQPTLKKTATMAAADFQSLERPVEGREVDLRDVEAVPDAQQHSTSPRSEVKVQRKATLAMEEAQQLAEGARVHLGFRQQSQDSDASEGPVVAAELLPLGKKSTFAMDDFQLWKQAEPDPSAAGGAPALVKKSTFAMESSQSLREETWDGGWPAETLEKKGTFAMADASYQPGLAVADEGCGLLTVEAAAGGAAPPLTKKGTFAMDGTQSLPRAKKRGLMLENFGPDSLHHAVCHRERRYTDVIDTVECESPASTARTLPATPPEELLPPAETIDTRDSLAQQESEGNGASGGIE